MHVLYNYKQAKYSANYIFVLKYVVRIFTIFAGLLVGVHCTYVYSCMYILYTYMFRLP